MPRVRVRNDTGAPLTHVAIRVPGTPGPGLQLGPLESGTTSGWATVPVAYAIVGVEVDGDAGPATLQPFDLMDEPPIEHGELTYCLRREGARLSVELESDATTGDGASDDGMSDGWTTDGGTSGDAER